MYFVKHKSFCQLICLLTMAGLTRETVANSANVSCGQPTANGAVTVTVTFADKTSVSWNVAGILKTDTPQQKAAKIRSAAPPAHAKLVTDGASGTVAGGTVNTVSATSNAGSTIKGMGFTADKTSEKEKWNVFALALGDHRGLASLSGVATGLDSDGAAAVVTVTASGVTATVNTANGMTAAQVETAIIAQLTGGGVTAGLANAAFIANDYPGLEGDGVLVQIKDIDANGLETQSTDTGLTMDVSALIDRSIPKVPAVSEWGLPVLIVVVLASGTILILRRRRELEIG